MATAIVDTLAAAAPRQTAMDVAKKLMTRAAEATLRNDPRAPRMAIAALAALQAATEGVRKSATPDP